MSAKLWCRPKLTGLDVKQAAAALGIHHSTVLRCIQKLELAEGLGYDLTKFARREMADVRVEVA